MKNPLTIYGEHDPATIQQMWTCIGAGADRAVLCADGHLGYAQPIGGVVAYKDRISLSGVGFDIGCGNTAVRTGLPFKTIENRVPMILADIGKRISFGVGRTSDFKVQADVIDDIATSGDPLVRDLTGKAEAQLGTVGSGNHYVDLFRDEEDMVWVGVHFGSRGFGHTLATQFLKLAGGKDGMHVAPTTLPVNSELGARYINAMELAGLYAKRGREAVCGEVLKILGFGKGKEWINNHHNYAWLEEHEGEKLWVVRKGATPAFPGQKGFVGGSMGDDAVIIEGLDTDEARDAMYSTVHGAGRVMGRNQAKKAFTREQMETWLREKGVSLIGGDLDESPMAYRRLDDVLEYHKGTIRILHRLRPFAVAMAGKGDFDPYKD